MNKKVAITIILFLIGMVVPTICVIKSIKFDQRCAGYLKNAADANTVELALERINHAIDYIEEHNLTDGYTSVLWKTEDENLNYWYKNILACKSELEGCLEGTALEKSNVLMKVRESLTDEGEKGTVLTIPKGISRYPYNALWGVLGLISYLLLCAAIVVISLYFADNY